MFEILFIIGMVAWMAELLCEYLYTLPVFGTLLAALLLIPALSWLAYHLALTQQFLAGVEEDRAPVPPEVFRWSLARPRWRRQILASALFLPFGWIPIFIFPARLDFSVSSLAGWLCGGLAIFTASIFLSRLVLYFRVAQWFDEMTPRLAGWFWLLLYRLSDNPEFIPENKAPAEERFPLEAIPRD